MEKIEQIVRMAIPDNDMREWLKVLHEGGLSEEEIDHMMVRLNETYKGVQGLAVVDREVKRIKEMIEEKHKYHINDEQENILRKNIERMFGLVAKD